MATVSETTRSTRITLGSTTAGPFSVGFRLFDTDGLEVFVDGVATSAYTLSASFTSGYADGATITLNVARDAGTVVQIDGRLIPGRADDYVNPDPGLTEKLNIELGRLWSAVSEVRMLARRSIRGLDDIEAVDGVSSEGFVGAEDYAGQALAAQLAAELARDQTLAVEATLPSWKGAWLTTTAYVFGDLVRQSGTTYFCIVGHTSGVFATDLAAARWEIFAQKGDAGAGAGDVVAANNGTEFNAASFRANVGLAIGTNVQAYNQLLAAVAGLGSTGIIARLSGSTAAARTLTGSAGITVADGNGVAGNPTFTLAFASQAEAEAGSEATKPMNALRVAQAIAALAPAGGVELIETITTGGTFIQFADLSLWEQVVIQGRFDVTGPWQVQFAIAGPTWRTSGYLSAVHDGVGADTGTTGVRGVRAGNNPTRCKISLFDLEAGYRSSAYIDTYGGSRNGNASGEYSTAENNTLARLIGVGGTYTFSAVSLRVFGVRRR